METPAPTRIKRMLPLSDEEIRIELAKPEELARLWEAAYGEDATRMTCRPVAERSWEESITLYAAEQKNSNSLLVGLYDGKAGTLLGRITLFAYNPCNRSMELGFYLLPGLRRKGVMGRAVKLLLGAAFAGDLLNKVYAQTASFNIAARSALERAGFKQDGVLREHHLWNGQLYDDHIFSLLQKEWVKSQPVWRGP